MSRITRNLVAVIFAVFTLAVAPTTAHAATTGIVKPLVTTSGQSFVDQSGNVVLLHGVNTKEYDTSQIPGMVALGVNLVRVRVPWAEFEPAPGDFDTTYLTELTSFVQAAQAAGINVLISFHQIRFSSCFHHGGDGVPPWYFTDGRCSPSNAGHAESAWWTSERSVTTYGQFVQFMMLQMGQYSRVIGYDLWNEPGGPECDSQTGVNYVLLWQHKLLRIMRATDPYRAKFVMTCGGGDLGAMHAKITDLWGTNPAQAVLNKRHVVLELHSYINGIPQPGCPLSDLSTNGLKWCPDWDATHNQMDNSYGNCTAAGQAEALKVQKAYLAIPLLRARRQDIPLFVGEWGINQTDCGWSVYQTQMTGHMLGLGISWTRYVYGSGPLGLLDSSGNLNPLGTQLQQIIQQEN